MSELTKTRVSQSLDGEPNHLIVPLTRPQLVPLPVRHMEDDGTAKFSDGEVAGLREYLLKGGFLWVDDFWGTEALASFEAELARVLPPRRSTRSSISRPTIRSSA